MKRPVQRVSQLISTFGPGAMIDLPTRSVVIGGLERWEMHGPGTWKTISEPRLVQGLRDKLTAEGWLQHGKSLSLRTPPVDSGRPGQPPKGVQATVFPEWFVCKVIEPTAAGQPAHARRRLMVKWAQLVRRSARHLDRLCLWRFPVARAGLHSRRARPLRRSTSLAGRQPGVQRIAEAFDAHGNQHLLSTDGNGDLAAGWRRRPDAHSVRFSAQPRSGGHRGES